MLERTNMNTGKVFRYPKFVLVIIFIFSACKLNEIYPNNESYEPEISVLDTNEVDVLGRLESDRITISYSSISKNEYDSVLNKNYDSYSFFKKEYRVNEQINHLNVDRHQDSLLIIKTPTKNITFKDTQKSRFFYDTQTEYYHVVKGVKFEEAFTLFINKYSGDIDLKVEGLNIESYANNSMFFYAETQDFGVDYLSDILIFEMREGLIDTLLFRKDRWGATNIFFENANTMYYEHIDFDKSNIRRSLAKMIINGKSK